MKSALLVRESRLQTDPLISCTPLIAVEHMTEGQNLTVQVINDIRGRTGAFVHLFDEENGSPERILQVRQTLAATMLAFNNHVQHTCRVLNHLLAPSCIVTSVIVEHAAS